MNVEEAYQILTSRKIRKAPVENPQLVRDCILRHLEKNEPIELSATWLGVKISKSGVADNADKTALDYLNKEIVKRIEGQGGKVKIIIMFADVNASYLEGYEKERINAYLASLSKMLEDYPSFELLPGNKFFWNGAFKLDGHETISLEEAIQKSGHGELLAFSKNQVVGTDTAEFSKLKNLANKHSLLVQKGLLSDSEAASRYLKFRRVVLQIYKKRHPNAIYFSYADPKLGKLINPQPTLYYFSLRYGMSNCPWFLDQP